MRVADDPEVNYTSRGWSAGRWTDALQGILLVRVSSSLRVSGLLLIIHLKSDSGTAQVALHGSATVAHSVWSKWTAVYCQYVQLKRDLFPATHRQSGSIL